MATPRKQRAGATPGAPYPNIRLDKFDEQPAAVVPNVEYVRPEVEMMRKKYELITDCMSGQDAIKKRTTHYLPMPNAHDKSTENTTRYEGYVQRAVFYNVVANTVSGLVGQVFTADPVSEYPDELEPLWWDCSGTGVTLVQQAKRVLTAAVSLGRCGLLTDFPTAPLNEDGTERAFTQQEVQDGKARPTIQFYHSLSIINWRFEQVGAVSVLSLVVLKEEAVIRDDGFELTKIDEYRVLRLVDGVYTVERWRREDEKQEGPFVSQGVATPKGGDGQPLTYIPFFFVGSQNNDAQVDKPPMYDMACINIAHYRNSADYEDSVYMVGQPTPFFSGLTQDWVDKVLKGTVQLGSRGAVPLPVGGTMGLVQAGENTMVKEAMDQKQAQMVALGAQLVEDKKVQRTLGEAKMESAVVVSTLATCAHNVSQAFESALVSAAGFTNNAAAKDKIIFQLSTDFAIQKLSADERRQLLAEWTGGLLAFSEARGALRASGIATLDDEEAREEISTDEEARIDLDAARAEATNIGDPDLEAKLAADKEKNKGKPKPTDKPAAE